MPTAPARSEASPNLDASAFCLHCHQPCAAMEQFCCAGCERVHAILSGQGLERFYELATSVARPAPPTEKRDLAWLEPLEQRIQSTPIARLTLEVQGVHCSACVWVIETLFHRQPGGLRCTVNPTRGSIDLTVRTGFDLSAWARQLEELGYLVGPASERDTQDRDLSVRMGICLALAANTMMLSLALYFGLDSGPLHGLARQVVFALSTAAMVVGGSWFVRSAVSGLRHRVLHLDVPIALGVTLAYAGSVWAFFAEDDRGAYFDSVTVFIALMLVGRWLQRRVVAKNRSELLSATGTEGLFVRRVEGQQSKLVPCATVRAGDRLLFAPGDLAPVDVELDEGARFRLDWVSGESEPRQFSHGSVAPAGAFLASSRSIAGRATTGFAESDLHSLLTPPPQSMTSTRFWAVLSKAYVIAVVALAGLALVLWWGDLAAAVRAATAVLVVTCPCAFGLAVPLAYEIVQSRARRNGIYLRSNTVLDRALAVRRVVFDKTGTLTVGRPALSNPGTLSGLNPFEVGILYNLASRSNHPKSIAVADAITDAELQHDFTAYECLSNGIQAAVDGRLYRLGRPEWASPTAKDVGEDQLVFSVAGEPRACFTTEETLRPGADADLRNLQHDGLEVSILSGDVQSRVDDIATRLGITSERAIGNQTAHQKEEWLKGRRAELDTLFVGDGVNDTLAADHALVSATPAIDRPFLPARCDFYFVHSGLAPIRILLQDARKLRRVVNANLGIALTYNAGAVTLALLGFVEPWLAAVLMPASSVTTLLFTTWTLRSTRRT